MKELLKSYFFDTFCLIMLIVWICTHLYDKLLKIALNHEGCSEFFKAIRYFTGFSNIVKTFICNGIEYLKFY